MSVRKRTWRDPKTGARKERWMIHIKLNLPDGTRKEIRKVSPINSRRGAERYERQVREALLSGSYRKEEDQPDATPQSANVPTLEAFSQEFLDSYARVNNKPSSVRSKEKILRVHLVPFFGELRLDQIGPRQIEKYKACKLKRLHRKTINNHLTVLHKLLDTAHEWDELEVVPRIRWLKAEKPEVRFLSFEEASRLLEAATLEPAWHTMILVALRTGLRQGELLGLQWKDLDLTRGQLRVRRAVINGIVGTPKSGKTRDLPLTPSVVAALEAHRHRRGPWVFCRDDGAQHTDGQCKRPLYRAYARAGLEQMGWHVLRHSFASHLVMRGVPLKVVQELLGHATIEMTMRYAHLSPSTLQQAVLELEEPQ